MAVINQFIGSRKVKKEKEKERKKERELVASLQLITTTNNCKLIPSLAFCNRGMAIGTPWYWMTDAAVHDYPRPRLPNQYHSIQLIPVTLLH